MKYSLYVAGFPSLYGGAGAELYHQLKIWRRMGVQVHLIPTQQGVKAHSLYQEIRQMGVVIHEPYDWECLPIDAPILSFCNEAFLSSLLAIRRRTRRTVFINCMTWLFPQEKEAMLRGDISLFLCQNEQVRLSMMPQLQALNDDPHIQYRTFRPYFDASPLSSMPTAPQDFFCVGHISRHDADKFTRDMWHIYEGVASPVEKQGIVLGFNHISAAKTGKPPAWGSPFRETSRYRPIGAALPSCVPFTLCTPAAVASRPDPSLPSPRRQKAHHRLLRSVTHT